MRKRIVFIAVLLQMLLASFIFAETTQITNGLNYLTSTQNADGSWTAGDESAIATAEAIETLKLLNQTGTINYANALSWLQNQSLESTNHIAERIYSLAAGGTDSTALVSYMDELALAWGGYNDFTVDNLDTASALQALKSINYGNQTTIQSAINYLLVHQNTDGGWGFDNGDASNLYMTALVVKTLSQFKTTYNLQNQINSGAAYLLSKQNADGGFGSSTSTAYETGLAMEALIAGGVNLSNSSQPAINYLASTQLADGSWNIDPYSTAIALRAFAYFKPDIVITKEDITISKPDPVAGDTIDISANIKNDGPATATNVVVKFYNGDPDAGGVLIGESIVPSIAAYGSAQTKISWTIPSGFAGKVFVVVNPLSSIDELNTNNDKASKNLTAATLPNLSITSADISFNPALPCTGLSVVMTANVRNDGETDAANVSVDFYDGDPAAGGMIIGGAVVSTIVAGASAAVPITSSFTSGDHVIYVLVDKENIVMEGSETNNTASKTLTVSASDIDLTVEKSSISFSPASPKEGDQITINATISNLGEGSANNVKVTFYLNDPQSGGTIIGSSNIPAIAGRSSAEVSITWNSTGYAGRNDIYVIVDPQNLICDASRINNQNYQTLLVLGNSGADLAISTSGIHIAPAQPNAGEQAVVSATIYNGGTQDAVDVPVEISLGDPRVGGTIIFSTQTIPLIPQGGSATVQATLNTTGYAGAYEIYVNIDPFGSIVETNKSNNLAHATIVVKAAIAPDLIVTDIDITDLTTDSQTLAISGTVIVKIMNKGKSGTTTPFEISFFEDTDKNKKFDPAIDKVFGTVTYSSNLAVGALDAVSMTISGTVLFKDNLLYAMADSSNDITELDEINNIYNTGQKCATQPQVGTFNPVEKWKWTGSTIMPTYNQVIMTPVIARIADTNGDNVIDENDVPAIIFFTRNTSTETGILRAISGDNGEEIFSISNPAYRIVYPTQIAVGDIDNDGFMEILALAIDYSILCFTNTGAFKWKSPVIYNNGQYYGQGMAIADIDNSGQPKIIIGATVLNNNGTILWKGTGGIGSGYAGPLSLVADINLDGVPEIIAGNTVYRNNGTILWQNKSLPDGLNAVGKFDSNDPYPQIVLVRSGKIYLVNYLGQIKWGPKSIPGGGNGGPPVVADFDGDGKPEIGVAGYSRYVVFRGDGTIVWQMITHDYTSHSTGSSVFDFEGDGKAEVLYNDELYFRIYNGSDGRKLFEIKNSSNTVYEYPVIADINNDGHAEIVIAANNFKSSGSTTFGIRVFGDANNSWVNTRQIWNQHTYHITNINDDGTIPRIEQNNWDRYNNYRCNVLTESNALDTPDATVSYITVDNADFPTTVNFSARIGNGGAISLPSNVNVSFYDGDPANGGVLIGASATSKDINSGGYEDVSVIWNNPATGNHNVFVVADKDNKITECTDANNTANALLTLKSDDVPPATYLPDLTLSPSDIVITAPSLTDGQTAIVNATIHNIGNSNTANVLVSFYDGDPQNGGTLIGSNAIPNIDAGVTAIASVTWNTFDQSGRNYIHVIIDPQNIIAESNENNNSSLISADVAVPTKPDLAITASDVTFSNNNPKAGELLIVNAVVHNLGIAVNSVDISLYDGDPSGGGTLVVQKVIQQIIPAGGTVTLKFEVNTLGLSASKSYFISIDPGNKIDEVVENNNIALRTINIMSADLNMTLSVDKMNYTANDNVQITLNIANLASASRSDLLDVQIYDSNGNEVESVISNQQINLGSHENKALAHTWNTGTTYTGHYKAVALLWENGNIVARAESSFVVNIAISVSSKVTTEKMTYNANETVAIISTVQSTSANAILNNLTAQITLTDSNGSVLFIDTKTIPILTPGQITQIKSYWNTATTPPGNCTLRLDVLDGANLLSTAMCGFAITGTNSGASVKSLQGTISATPAVVYAGQDVTTGYTVTNNGNEDIPLLKVKILIVDPVTQTVKMEILDQQAVAKGSSVIGVGLNNVSTSTFTPGTYIAILQVATQAASEFKTIANANFEVKAGLDVTKKIPDTTRLLIWVNENCNQIKNSENVVVSCCSPNGSECTRIDLLESMFNNASIKYLIVYTKDDFQKNLRSSYFTDYLILGNHQPLEDHYAYELRELVHSGKGLIASLFVDEGSPNTPLAGLKVSGYLPLVSRNINLNDSAIAASGVFASQGKASKTEALSGATVAGWISDVNLPAVVLNDYGWGRSVYYAFDMGATLNDQNYEKIASLVVNSITYVHKPLFENSFLPNQFVPVEVQIKSLGGIFDLKLKETYPVQIKIYDPVTGLWVTDNPWLQDMHIESNETKYFNYYVLTPDIAGTYTLNTEIGYMKNDAFQLYKEVDTQLTVDNDSTVYIDSVISAMNGLAVSNKENAHVSNAIKYMEQVKDREGNNTKTAFEDNIQDILKAVEAIMKVTSCDTTQIRLVMDMLLKIYQGKYSFG
jgi:subtilase family serine protease/prenyltransferase beta subunit